MTSTELIAKSTAALKRMLKTATDADKKQILAELNCRGIYIKKGGMA